jgi:NADH-quinone oxidoreductase subunit N
MHPLLAPEFLLTGLAVLLLLWDAFFNPSARLIGRIVLGGVFLAAVVTCWLPSTPALYWEGLYAWNPLAKFFKVFFLAATGFVTWMNLENEESIPSGQAEFYILPLFTAAGMLLLASANDLMVMFVALELVTISFYILVGYQRKSAVSLEAAVKYLILGALSSAFLVMGIAYVFGMTGSTQFDKIAAALLGQAPSAGILFGMLLVLVGLSFKVAAVPFHLWAPDVYQGAPTPVTAFLSVGSKAAGFVLLIRLLAGPFSDPALASTWTRLLLVLASGSLILGNLAAIPQRNIKRMLAYSGISHAGFMLVALGAGNALGFSAVLFYLVAYLLAGAAAFLAITVAGKHVSGDGIPAYAGLSRRSPLLAWALALALVSMAGIPPLAGFFGKFMVFMAAWQSGAYMVVWIAIGSAVAGLYYYLGVVRAMFWSEPIDAGPIRVRLTTSLILAVLIGLLLLLGFWAQPLLAVIQELLPPQS